MANKVYTAPESALTWDSAGTSAALTCTSLASGSGRVGAQLDRGSGSRAMRYRWEFRCKVGSNPTVGNMVELYLATAHTSSSNIDGDVGTADAALSAADKRRNLLTVGTCVMDVADSTKTFRASGFIWVPTQYVSPVVYNNTGQTFSATASDHVFILIPMPDEIQ